jgi:hypothetical protein
MVYCFLSKENSKNPGPEGPALGTSGRGYNIKL